MDAMKLQPANPSFTQARDAILAADNALNGGADLLEIWTAFARRGLGQLASTSDSNSESVTIDFTIPPEVLGLVITGSTPANGAVVATTPTSYVLTTGGAVAVPTLDASDLTVNGIPAASVAYTPGATTITFTFASDPVAGQGPQTIHVAAGAFHQASD